MNKVSILDLSEDQLNDTPINPVSQTSTTKRKAAISKPHSFTEPTLIETHITKVATVLGIDLQELRDWAKETSVPTEILKKILLTARRFKLNPLLGHIAWEFNRENLWDIYIPIDGWIKLIHREPSFKGILFNQSTETENGIPIWMECTIYRYNLRHPITVREYYVEIKTDHPVWTQMPIRMLRHKTLQQCARLAFGISTPELKIPIKTMSPSEKNIFPKNLNNLNPKEILKRKLMSNSTSA